MSDVDEKTVDIRERGTYHRFVFQTQGNTEADCDDAADRKMLLVLTVPDAWTIVSKSIIEEAVQSMNGQSVVSVLQVEYVAMRLAGEVPWLS